jgi:hypothetical protein
VTIYANNLRGNDDILVTGPFEPTTSVTTLIIHECLEAEQTTYELETAEDVLRALANFDLIYRASVGLPLQLYNGASWDNVSPSTEFGEMLVRNITVVEHPDKPHAWSVAINESSMGNIMDGGTTPAATGAPAVSVNISARTRQVDAWRVQPLMSVPVDALDPTETGYFDPTPYRACSSVDGEGNIGGTEVDVNGVPLKTSVEQNVISIEFIARSPYYQWDGTYKQDEEVAYYLNALALGNTVGARNAESLFGYPMGTLRTTDVAVQPLHHEFKRVIWTLVADEWYHADQRPWTGKQGVIKTVEAPCATPGGDAPIFFADVVFWRQSFLEAFTMGSNPDGYFPAGGWDLIWAKFGADVSTYTAATWGP